MFIVLECEICGKRNSIAKSKRYPSLNLCVQCIMKFQEWVWRNMNESYVRHMVGQDVTQTLIKDMALDGMFLVDSTTATTVLAYVNSESITEYSPSPNRYEQPSVLGAPDMAVESDTGFDYFDSTGGWAGPGQQASREAEQDSLNATQIPD